MTHNAAKQQNLEPVFPEAHELGQRIFWDAREGEYYDAATDLYLWGYDPTTRLADCFNVDQTMAHNLLNNAQRAKLQ